MPPGGGRMAENCASRTGPALAFLGSQSNEIPYESMTLAIMNALAPSPRPAPERADPPRDERDFARALEEDEEIDEPRERESGPEPAAEAASDPAAQPAAALTKLQAAFANGLAILAPTPAPAAGSADAEEAPAVAPQLEPETLAAGLSASEVAAPAAAAPASAATPVAPVVTPGAPAEPARGEVDAQQKPGQALQGDGESDPGPEGDAAWTPPGPARPAGGGSAANPGAPVAAPQPAFAAGEALAPVRVLRQATAEASKLDLKSGAPQPAPASAAPAGPAAAAPAVQFDAKLLSADAAASTSSPLPARPAAAPPPAAQLAVHVARAVEDGVRRLEVRLNPAELGRVEVKLDVGHDGRVLAVVAADRQDTLELLQRDARGLERALQDAGIRADSGSLSFTLRQQERDAWSGDRRGSSGSGSGEGARGLAATDEAAIAARPRANLRALDISV